MLNNNSPLDLMQASETNKRHSRISTRLQAEVGYTAYTKRKYYQMLLHSTIKNACVLK